MILYFSWGNIFPIFAVYGKSTQTGFHLLVKTTHSLTDMMSITIFFGHETAVLNFPHLQVASPDIPWFASH